ncbi:ABC transporter substrate-binding protein [Natronosalvus caseinilyticus]|uniref:ABC transporter substrate-binding protein n=1 Tax=Natronosalvus caseinilyticus TaxID=2953747 RepID=UPI0028AB7370|nr:extracellular solute-binding protein [Natronosalvus caseinilyticus]
MTGAVGAAGITSLAGCLSNITGGNGGGSVSEDDEFQSELEKLNLAENWRERRLTSFDEWPEDVRSQFPDPDQGGVVDAWASSEAVQQGPWSPPDNWEDTIASDVDQLEIINFGGLGGDPATAATYAAFERETGIEIVPQEIAATQALTKQQTFLSQGSNEPAIFQVTTPTSYSTFIQAGYLEPIDELMPEDEMWEPYPDYIQEAFTSDIGPDEGDHLYGAPGIRWNTFMHIRKDLLEEQGIDPQRVQGEYTWEDVDMVAQEFQDTDIEGYAYWGNQWNYVIKNHKEMIYQQGANLVQDDGTVRVDTDESARALERMVHLKEEGLVSDAVTSYNEGTLNDLLVNGDLAMHSSMGSQVSRVINAGLEPGEEYIVALHPKASEGPDPQQNGLGHLNNVSINRYADPAKKVAAALYMDCRFSYESQWWEYTYEANDSYMNPVYEDAAELGSVPFNDIRMEAANNIDNDYFPASKEILEAHADELKAAIGGDKSVDDALSASQENIDIILDQ